MNFKQRILPLLAYYKEYGTIRNIQQKDKYNYNGKEHNIGNLLHTLRIQYRLRDMNEAEKNKKNNRLLPLKDEEVQILEKLGMIWKVDDTKFNEKFFMKRIEPLIAYYKEHKTLSSIAVKDKYFYNGKEVNIGSLIRVLRIQYKLREADDETKRKIIYIPLKDEEVQILEKMGMTWNAISFEARIAPLIAYYKENGSLKNLTINTKYVYNEKEENIGTLINILRIRYRLRTASEEIKRKTGYTPLSDEEVIILEKMGILWDVSSFEARIAPLIAYYKEHGTIDSILTDDKYYYNGKDVNIGRLIRTLRLQYKIRSIDKEERIKSSLSPLSDEEVKILEKMGMIWNAFPTFEKRIEALTEYYKENGTIGDVEIRQKYTYQGKEYNIGNLISSLRAQYKLRSATEEERKKTSIPPLKDKEVEILEKMGMIWNAKFSLNIDMFKIRIAPLLDYYKKYGTIRNIQQKDKYNYNGKEYNIGILINNLKTQYKLRNANEEERKKSRYLPLKDEEVELLESIGMLWAARRNI